MKTVSAARSAVVALVGALALGATAPAYAADPVAAPVGSVEAPAPAAAKAAERRYCVKAEMTGSRIAKKVCRTRADWLGTGFDPLATDK